jgi:hypothetical protein
MGNTYVKNGTPAGNEHLCRTCSWGQITTGYRESDVVAFCTNTNPNFRLPFVVHKCSEYYDKHKPDWDEMKKLAIEVEPTRISQKTTGFNLVATQKPATPSENTEGTDNTDAEDEEAARL